MRLLNSLASRIRTSSRLRTVARSIVPILLIALMATPALAQRDVTLRPGAGGAILTRPDNLDTYLGSGTGLVLDLDVQLLPEALPGLTFTLGSAFDRFTVNESDLLLIFSTTVPTGASSVEDGELMLFSGIAGLRYTFQTEVPARPYVFAGAGAYHNVLDPARILVDGQTARFLDGEGDVVELGGTQIDTQFGYQAGVGIDFEINETYGFFVETRYIVVRNTAYQEALVSSQSVNSASTRYFPIRFGATIRLATFGN